MNTVKPSPPPSSPSKKVKGNGNRQFHLNNNNYYYNNNSNSINKNNNNNEEEINKIENLLKVIYKLENDISFLSSLLLKSRRNEKDLSTMMNSLQSEVMLKDAKIKEMEVLLILEKQSHLQDLKEERMECQKILSAQPKRNKKKENLLMLWSQAISSDDTLRNIPKFQELLSLTCKLIPSMKKKVIRSNNNNNNNNDNENESIMKQSNKIAIFLKHEKIECNFKQQGLYYPGSIKSVLPNGYYTIHYDDGEVEYNVYVGNIRRRIELPPNVNNNDKDDDTVYTEIDDDIDFSNNNNDNNDNNNTSVNRRKKLKKKKK